MFVLYSCNTNSQQVKLEQEIDSVSYSIGVNEAKGLLQKLEPMGYDTVINLEVMVAGYMDAMKENEKISMEDGREIIGKYFNRLREKQMEEQFGDNKEAGIKFLEENKKREGVKTTESGLQYEILKVGTGPVPVDNQNVMVHYTGILIDGTVFDSSVERGEPFRVNTARGVIEGWLEALKMMPVGSKWKIFIPQELAYGARQTGKINPFSALIFEIELLSIEEAKEQEGIQK